MRILLAHFKILDYGGIINYTELLALGLKNAGHTVDALMLKNSGPSGIPKERFLKRGKKWYLGNLGLWVNQQSGWAGMKQFNYAADLRGDIPWNAGYDLTIYVVPVPSKSKQNAGDASWLRLFHTGVGKQISIVHDGNMQKLYAHIKSTVPYLSAVVGVHDAAFNSCEVLALPRKLIPNAHDIDEGFRDIIPMSQREDSIVSMQTFKRWKRVDCLIRAIPFLWTSHVYMCGGGIEQRYMTSIGKCKPEYLDEEGYPIWDTAIEAGMEYLGYVNLEQRDELLGKCKVLVDPSWSLNYAKMGSHFNRVMIEAMSHGCVPVCTDLAMRGNSFFKAGVNYLEIPYNATPKQYGDLLSMYLSDDTLLQSIQDNNLKEGVLSRFDADNIALEIAEAAFIDHEVEEVVENPTFDAKAEKLMEFFTGV